MDEVSMISPKIISEQSVKNLIVIILTYLGKQPMQGQKHLNFSTASYGVIVTTLGKFCLQNHTLAKSIVPILGSLLDNKTVSKIKINALVALTDLCVRYTSLIEPYLGDMCLCLKDEDVAVRRMALTLLFQLLKEDYVKLKGPYFFYVLCMLNDPVVEIKEYTSSFLINCALAKQKNLMSTFFIQAIFFYNDFKIDYQVTNYTPSLKEHEAFCISGAINREIRRKLYRFMLEHMQDDQRFKVTHKLSTDILAEICEGTIKLDNKGSHLLEDSLFCLACEEIRLLNLNQSKEMADDGSGEVNRDAIIGKLVQRTIITQALKRSYVDVIIPTILTLKAKLIEIKSPLIRDLRVALRELMKDFKEEINEILACDKEAAAEVALELQNIENDEKLNSPPRPRDPHIVMLENIFVQCEKLPNEILAAYGYGIPVLNDKPDDAAPPINLQSPTGKTNNINTEESSANKSNSSTTNNLRRTRNSSSTIVNESLVKKSKDVGNNQHHNNVISKRNKNNSSIQQSQQHASESNESGDTAAVAMIRPSQSSLSTAYGEDTAASAIHSGSTRDSQALLAYSDNSSTVSSKSSSECSSSKRNTMSSSDDQSPSLCKKNIKHSKKTSPVHKKRKVKN